MRYYNRFHALPKAEDMERVESREWGAMSFGKIVFFACRTERKKQRKKKENRGL